MSVLPSAATFPSPPLSSRAGSPTAASPIGPAPTLLGAGILLLRALGSRMHRLAAARREERLRRAAAQGRPIFVGSPERPYEPAAWPRAPWEILASFSGLAVRVTARSPALAGQLTALAELDRRHAVAVDLVVAAGDPESRRVGPAVRRLAEQGITTRVLLQPRRGAHPDGDGLRQLVEAVRRAGAFDLQLADGTPRAWARQVRHLRLEHGFPHPLPGRG